MLLRWCPIGMRKEHTLTRRSILSWDGERKCSRRECYYIPREFHRSLVIGATSLGGRGR